MLRLFWDICISGLVALEQVAGIYFVFYIIQAGVIAVCDDTVADLLEFIKVIDNLGAEEGCSVFQGWLVDYYGCTLG